MSAERLAEIAERGECDCRVCYGDCQRGLALECLSLRAALAQAEQETKRLQARKFMLEKTLEAKTTQGVAALDAAEARVDTLREALEAACAKLLDHAPVPRSTPALLADHFERAALAGREGEDDDAR